MAKCPVEGCKAEGTLAVIVQPMDEDREYIEGQRRTIDVCQAHYDGLNSSDAYADGFVVMLDGCVWEWDLYDVPDA